MALTMTYMGARTDHSGIGGSGDTPVNINQLDPAYLALGAALNDALPNPFLGNPNVPLSLSTPATLPRSRLLLPFPQYRQVNAYQVTEGRARYNAAVVELSKRATHGLGRTLQLHLQRPQGQLRRRVELLHRRQPGAAGEQLQLPGDRAGVRQRPAVHDRLLRPDVGIRRQRARRAAPRDPRPDRRAAVRQRTEVAQRRGAGRLVPWRLDHLVDRQPAERLPAQRAAAGGRAAQRRRHVDRQPAEPGGQHRARDARQLRGSAGQRRSPDRDLDQPGGLRAGAGRHHRQRAADDHRGAIAGSVQHRRGVPEERRHGRVEDRAGEAGSAEHAEPAERAGAAGRQHGGQLELRPDHHSSRFHADHAADGAGSRSDASRGLGTRDWGRVVQGAGFKVQGSRCGVQGAADISDPAPANPGRNKRAR